jgi:hypothetical protein
VGPLALRASGSRASREGHPTRSQLARLRLQRIQRNCQRQPVCIGVDRAGGTLLLSCSMTW